MNNHFYIAYAGNKRNEVKQIYNNIRFDDIDTVVEPFCGTCAVSYYIWLSHPNLKFVLNDCNVFLFDMFLIYKDETKIDEFNEWYNNFIEDINKEKYTNYLKNNQDYKGWFLKNKIYAIRRGCFQIVMIG
jgi:site-specific DNA-adenine methylase